MSTNKISWKRVTIVIIVALLVFATIWSQTHQKSDDTQTEQTTSVNDATSTDETQTGDANASDVPAQDTSNMQATIDSLNQQIADKDVTITELQQQVTDLQNGTEKNGGVTFQEFLNLYFWPDGHTYKMAEDKKLYSNYACTNEYAVNVADYTFPCNRTLQMTLDNGLTIHMLMTTDGQILWTPSPWLNQAQ